MSNFINDLIATALIFPLNELLVLKFSSGEITKRTTKFPTLNSALIKDELGNTRLSATALNDIKIRQDVKVIVDTLFNTVQEFQSKCTFFILLKTIEDYTTKNAEQENQIRDHETIKTELNYYNSKLRHIKVEANEKLMYYTQKLNNLKSSWRLITKLNGLEDDLVKKWEHTRFTQATIAGENEEKNLRSLCSKIIRETQAEKLTATNINAFLKLEIQKYNCLINYWEQRYTNEMNDIQSRILEKENLIAELKKSYYNHNEIFFKRDRFINDYIAQKAEQDRLIKLEIKRIESAVKIQSWWRGVMVRRGLGSFRKKSKRCRKEKKQKQ